MKKILIILTLSFVTVFCHSAPPQSGTFGYNKSTMKSQADVILYAPDFYLDNTNIVNLFAPLAHAHAGTDITSGTLPAARLPAFTGDATSSAGSSALTLANSGVTPGVYGNSNYSVTITLDAKGRITSVTTNLISTGTSVFNNGSSVSNPNFIDSSTATITASASTNLQVNPTNLANAQISASAAIDISKLSGAAASATTISAGAGLSGGGSLAANRTMTLDPSTFVGNVTFWDGSQSSRTWTFNLSGTDPVFTISSGSVDLTTGTLKYGGNTVATSANHLGYFAATTSAQLYGNLSDETGSSSGALAVFSKSPTIETPTINSVRATAIALGSGTSFAIDPAYSVYTATASGNVTINLATNSVTAGVALKSPIALYLYDGTGSRTITLSSSGTGGTAFTGGEKSFGFGTNSATAGTNLVLIDWDGAIWHFDQSTAQMSAAQIGTGAVSDTEFGYLDGVTSAIQTQINAKQSTLTDSAGLRGALSDETGSGLAVFGTNPTMTWDVSALSDDSYAGQVITGYNAGEALTQWDVVYLSSSSTWLKADADTSGKFPAVGVVVATTSNGAAATILVRGAFRDDGGTSWTVGGTLYLSATAGAMTSTAPTTSTHAVHALGTAITAHRVYLNPSPVWFEN